MPISKVAGSITAKFTEKWNQVQYRESLAFVFVGLTSGLVCCLYASFFAYTEKTASSFFAANPDLIFIVAPLTMALALAGVRWFAPGAFGSGIPQVICTLEVKRKDISEKYLNLKIILVKISTSIVALFGGAAIGREGPSLQVSAAIGNIFGRLFERTGVKLKSEQLVIAGAASGLAAAFNTPIGGIVYAVEELSHEHIRSYKTGLLMSVLISGFVAQLLLGSYLYLGYPEVPSSFSFSTLLIVACASVFAGMAGGLFSKLLLLLSNWRKRLPFKKQGLVAAFVGLLLSFSYFYLGTRTVFSGKESINFVLFDKNSLSFSEGLMRFFSPLMSSMTGIAGGIFSPSLSAGASIGGLIANFFDPSLRTLLGLTCMIGFLTGVTHTPITSFVLVLEMTDRHSAIFPMMLAALFSSMGAKLLGKVSFYEAVAHQITEEAKATPPSITA